MTTTSRPSDTSVPLAEVAITSGFRVLTGILPEGAFMLPDVKDVAAMAAPRRRAGNAPAAGGCCRKWSSIRIIPIFATAATTRSPLWPRHDGIGLKGREPREAGIIAAVLALIADQGSKLYLLYVAGFVHMVPGDSVPVLPFFNLVMVWNPGVSYGLFPASGWLGTAILVIFAGIIAPACLAWWLWRLNSLSLGVGIGLVIGGAIGNNLIDRVIYGRVADFFHFYAFGHDWYVFNVADVAITLGAIAIIYEVLKPEHSPSP